MKRKGKQDSLGNIWAGEGGVGEEVERVGDKVD